MSNQNKDQPPDLGTSIRTLTCAGFALDRIDRKPGYALIQMTRLDEFRVPHRYCFSLSENGQFTHAQVEASRVAAERFSAKLVLIGAADTGTQFVLWDRFVALLGGPVFAIQPMDPAFRAQLIQLGHNVLPSDMTGKPDDLFEGYVRMGLEFILGIRVVRYGQERLFEARPDGIILPHQDFSALYDAKAYTNGYEVTSDTIRQFRSYVDEFRERYGTHLNRLTAFIVVSGNFPHKESTLAERSRDLQSECGVPLVFLTAEALAKIIEAVMEHPRYRRSVRWNRILLDTVISPRKITAELEAIRKDQII